MANPPLALDPVLLLLDWEDEGIVSSLSFSLSLSLSLSAVDDDDDDDEDVFQPPLLPLCLEGKGGGWWLAVTVISN